MNEKRRVIVNVMHQNRIDYTLEEFEEDVRKIAKAGGTHVMINQIEKSRWIWEKDMSDPYPNWGMLLLSLFKLVVPEPLKRYLPEDYAERNYNTLKQRMDIARKYGLKGALTLCEPFYLPEEVYREHPHWRGPRCEHPRRARKAYHSPCVDHPEVLEMYRNAVAELVRDIEIDFFFMYTNDSGGGLCWSGGLYPGANGPSSCKHRSMADRVTGFLDALAKGARDSGKDLEIEFVSNIGFKEIDHELNSIGPSLKDNMSVNRTTRSGVLMTAVVDVEFEYTLAPVKNLPMVFSFIEKLEAAGKSGARNLYLNLAAADHDEYLRIAEAFIRQPVSGLRNRISLLGKLAADIAGEEHADELIEGWSDLQKAMLHFMDTRIEGLSWISVNQRWINRPFVLYPHELTEEEKGYYRPFQFQANDEAQADDLLNMQCTSFIRGAYAVNLASKALEKAMDRLQRAADAAKRISDHSEGERKEKMRLFSDRLLLLRCFFQNAVHAMQFQNIIDGTDYSQSPEISPRWPIDADPTLLAYEALTRAENR